MADAFGAQLSILDSVPIMYTYSASTYDSTNMAGEFTEQLFFDISPTGQFAILGKQAGSYKIVVLDTFKTIVDAFAVDLGCAVPKQLVFNDTIVVVAGEEEVGDLKRMFMKSYNLTGQTAINNYTLVAEDVYTEFAYVNFGPGANVTGKVINTGNTVVNGFQVHTNQLQLSLCGGEFAVQRFETPLNPGDTAVFRFDSLAADQHNLIQFFISGANNGLMKTDACSGFVNTPVVPAHGALTLYPNPSQNRVYFSGLAQPATFTLHNLQGQQVFSQVAEPAMDVSQLSSGIYLYQITANDGTLLKSGKLIKQ